LFKPSLEFIEGLKKLQPEITVISNKLCDNEFFFNTSLNQVTRILKPFLK
jgi:hypothetical protein